MPALAVIPALAGDGLRARLADAPAHDLLQHGYRHVNHAPTGHKKVELGDHRPVTTVTYELRAGWRALNGFAHVLPVLVPPWNRIHDGVRAGLRDCGLRALSTFTPRQQAHDAYGLVCVNTHIDPIAWRDGRVAIESPRVFAACSRFPLHSRSTFAT